MVVNLRQREKVRLKGATSTSSTALLLSIPGTYYYGYTPPFQPPSFSAAKIKAALTPSHLLPKRGWLRF